MKKVLGDIVNTPKKEALHAEIKVIHCSDSSGCIVLDDYISVHFSETESAWRAGVIGIEVGGKREYVSIDALLSTIYTAYNPTLLRKGVYFFEHLMMRVKSFFICFKKK